MDLSFCGGRAAETRSTPKSKVERTQIYKTKTESKTSKHEEKKHQKHQSQIMSSREQIGNWQNIKICAQKKKITRVVLVLVFQYFEEKNSKKLWNFFIIIV